MVTKKKADAVKTGAYMPLVVYMRKETHNELREAAFKLTRATGKHVTMSQIIRLGLAKVMNEGVDPAELEKHGGDA